MKTLRKYLGLYGAFFRASLTADLEFRANFVIRILTDILWYVAQIASFEVLFLYTSHVGDWDVAQTRVFLGILFVIDATFMIVFSANLDTFTDLVRKGNLDLLLTKPISSQFMISLQRATTAHLGNLALGIGWLIYSLLHFEGFAPWRLLWLFLMVPSGVMIFYSLRFLFSSCTLIFVQAENLQYLWYSIYRLGLRSDTIYFPWLKILILTVVPVGLIASAPARVVLGINSPWLALWCLTAALASLWGSHRFWRYALSKYASASS